MFKSLLAAIAIVAHEPGYYTSLARHIQRWLGNEGVAAEVVTPAQMSAALPKGKTAFLVGFDNPSAAEVKTLADYTAKGGRLVVFHSASPALGRLMGVKPVGYRAASRPGEWSRMSFSNLRPPGFPASILQTSSVLQRARPVDGSGAKVIGTWLDRAGKPTGEPAWIQSPHGWWMTHILTADGNEPAKAQLCAAMVGVSEPKLWSAPEANKRRLAAREELKRYAVAQTPARGEIRAVWDHSGCGLYPGDWPRTMKFLKNAKVTDLFVNVAGAGFAHYPSAVLPRSKTFLEEGDQLAQCLKAAAGTGIRVHAWVLCFNATRGTPATLEDYGKRGWRLKSASTGKATDYLDPSKAAVREHLLKAIDELQTKYPALNGIHLDFVRWYEGAKRPANAASVITDFVLAARRHVKRPRWFTTAVLGKYPACIASVGQDWTAWLDANLVDYVVPMDYSDDNARFESYLKQHAAVRAHARRTIAGIGVTANESRLTAREVIDQIKLARRYGLAGVALFDLDFTLEREILPFLCLGLWR